MDEQRRSIAALLEKRATFGQGLKELSASVASTAPNNDAKLSSLLELLPRTMVLLRTRYSSPTQWKAAAEALRVCVSHCVRADQQARIQHCLAEVEAFLTEHDVELPAAAVRVSTEAAAAAALADVPMEELILGLGQPQRGVDAHYDDTGPILDDEARRRRIEGGGDASTSAPAASGPPGGQGDGDVGGSGGGDGNAAGDAGRGPSRLQQRADLQAAILEGIQAVYAGMSAVARGTEVIERELDAVLAALQARAGQQQPSKPPASRKVVAALPRIRLDEASLESQIGRDAVCPVCTEALQVGDEVQLLPCKHSYHVACLAPWLEQNNSCPICRQELPTDDPNYEARKEREAEEARDRAGAANALSHNEFAYI
ncbi:hypothetical protein PLESTB_000205900 [Pleodorina starrii]|uniref:RING-type E3 ubiquitin transferase n=1 Tax=Pleodorina starrii TaxID=330485 RepID=A0A9W6BCK9_9CHLO|nr:hypothetical protein PLESTM_000325600 [Pleodorina starrii]GLC49315.1 hypothetical protein PLESTB_000205900 [Pleodorina starrii]GLC73427.1 hypothetical protein PLESTF_001374300 [Pleodorina starrii]